jgi:hypothetical protein
MFDYLRAVLFQSHRDTRIDFHEGVNVIFGLSQAGKSSLTRAIRLVLENRPVGARFYSRFAPDKGKTLVELGIHGSGPVSVEKSIRRKSDGEKKVEETAYGLDLPRDPAGDVIRDADDKPVSGIEFTGVSKEVPDQILEILNMSDLNMQKQLDPHFLITSSAGEIARTINRITRLEDVDGWVSDTTKRINETKSNVKMLEGEAKGIETELARYVGFEDLAEDVKTLQDTDKKLKIAQRAHFRLDGLLVKIEDADRSLEKIRPALAIQEDISRVIALEGQITSLKRRITLIERLQAIDEQVKALKSIVGDLKEANDILTKEQRAARLSRGLDRIKSLDDVVRNLTALNGDLDFLKKMASIAARMVKLDGMLERIEVLDEEMIQLGHERDVLKQQKLAKLKEDHECPFCLSEIDDKAIRRMEKEL